MVHTEWLASWLVGQREIARVRETADKTSGQPLVTQMQATTLSMKPKSSSVEVEVLGKLAGSSPARGAAAAVLTVEDKARQSEGN
jgi:hypothetical protein